MVDATSGSFVFLREALLVHTNPDAIRVGLEVLLDKSGIADRGGHEHIGLATALNEATHDLLAVTDHPLRRGGFVIDIERVNVRAVVEQVLGDRNVAREVKGRLAVAATGFGASAELPTNVRRSFLDEPPVMGEIQYGIWKIFSR